MPLRPSRRRTRARGQSLVELAIIAPIFLLLLLTALDLGRLLYSQITITNAAKEGALVASQGGTFTANQPCSDTNTVMCGALTEAKGGFVEVDKAKVDLAPAVCDKNAMYPSSGAPPNVTVSIDAPFHILTPIIGNIVGDNLVLSASADAQCLVVPQVTYPPLPAPVAAFTASTTSGTAPLTVNLDASASYSTGSTITSYAWTFGAGNGTGSGALVSHTYSSSGSFTVVLTVTDARGQTDTDQTTITVGGAPPPVCPTADFSATDTHNNGNPHRMRLDGSINPSSSGWTWTWTGAISASGQSPQVNFPAAGPQSVTLTVSKGSCSVAVTKTVTAP